MKEENNNHFKIAKYLRKIVYSSLLLVALIVGGQYVRTVNAHADGNADIHFQDDVSNQQIGNYYGYEAGKTINLRNKILRLEDQGYDTSGVPTLYTPTAGSNVIHIRAINSDIPLTETKQYKLQVRLVDQNGSYVNTRNYQSDSKYWDYQSILNDIKNAGYKIVQEDDSIEISDQTIDGNGNNFYATLHVIEPEHIVNVNYIDQSGNNVKSLQHAVTDYGHTDITNDLSDYAPSGISVIDNKDSDSNIYVSPRYSSYDTSFNYQDSYSNTNGTFVETSTPSVLENPSYGDNSNPLDYVYHTSVTVKDNKGNVIDKFIVSSNYDNIVDTSYFLGKYGNDIQDENSHIFNPNYIDLTKGPYVFKTNSSLPSSMPNNASTNTPNYEDLPTINDAIDKSKPATLSFITDYGVYSLDNRVEYARIDRSGDDSAVFDDYNNNDYQLEVKGYIGQTESLRNLKLQLNDFGYDTSNIPDEITFNKAKQEIKVVPYLNNFPSKSKSLIKLINQFYNYVGAFTVPLEKDPDKRMAQDFKALKDMGVRSGINQINNLEWDNGQNNIYTVQESTPLHQLTINYVDQHNKVVFSTKQLVDYYGHTDFYDDQSMLHTNGIAINPGQSYVSNKQDTATVYVTSSDTFQNLDSIDSNRDIEGEGNFVDNPKDYGVPEPMIVTTTSSQHSHNPNKDAFYAPMRILDKNGKTLYYGVVSNTDSNIVTTDNLSGDVAIGYRGFNMSHITDLPQTLDLTKGPFVFHSTEVSKSSYFDHVDDPISNQEHSQKKSKKKSTSKKKINKKTAKKAAKANKPSKSKKAKKAAKTKKAAKAKGTKKAAKDKKPAKAKRAKKAAKTKKPAKAKRAKKATKSKKAAKTKKPAKAKRAKKAAKANKPAKAKRAKKAVKTKKSAVAKKSIKAKKLSVIKSDKKKIKTLKAQLKKLKKSHSKASKKKYAKAAKALKKANSSLKAATKFVNNYK